MLTFHFSDTSAKRSFFCGQTPRNTARSQAPAQISFRLPSNRSLLAGCPITGIPTLSRHREDLLDAYLPAVFSFLPLCPPMNEGQRHRSQASPALCTSMYQVRRCRTPSVRRSIPFSSFRYQ